MDEIDPAIVTRWHAHIYYDPGQTRDRAARVRNRIAEAFPDAVIGNWHDEPVGPHSQAMYQVVFETAAFQDFVTWIAFHREGLPVLIHAADGVDGRSAHTTHAIWMGRILPVRFPDRT